MQCTFFQIELTSLEEVRRAPASCTLLLTKAFIFLKPAMTDIGTVEKQHKLVRMLVQNILFYLKQYQERTRTNASRVMVTYYYQSCARKEHTIISKAQNDETTPLHTFTEQTVEQFF